MERENSCSLTLVCGSNDIFYEYLKRLITNILAIIKNEEHRHKNIKLVVYDLGLSSEQLIEIKTFKDIILETFDFDKYPEHVSLKKYYGKHCNYSWKPIIIYETCEKYGGMIHWMDSRSLYTKFTNLIEILTNTYIYTPVSYGKVKDLTHLKTLQYFDKIKETKHEQYLEKRNRSGGVFAINYNIDWCKDFVKEWKDLSLIKECISPEGTDRSNHRQDQSLLTILYYLYQDKYNFKDYNMFVDLIVHGKK